MESVLLDIAGHRRSPATMPGRTACNSECGTIASTSGLDVAKEWLVSPWLATVGARYGVGVAVAR